MHPRCILFTLLLSLIAQLKYSDGGLGVGRDLGAGRDLEVGLGAGRSLGVAGSLRAGGGLG